MKKVYSFFLIFLVLQSLNSFATTINVAIANNSFTPQTFTANVGDVVVWTLSQGTHNVTGVSVPSGAAAIASPTLSTVGTTYSYTITVAGNYGYQCTFHSGMVGGFAVSSSTTGINNIAEPVKDLLTSAYPNPFKDKITIKYKGIQSIEIYNIVGEKLKTIELSPVETKVEIDFDNLPSGVYFYRTYNEGTIIETKRIVKTK